MAEIANHFRNYLSCEGITLRKPESVSRTEKTASVEEMKSRFLDKAEKAIMSKAVADMWSDPILGNLLEHGQISKAASLAEGRFVDAGTAEKIAQLSVEEAHALAEPVLTDRYEEKIASLPQPEKPATSFPHLFCKTVKEG